MEAPTVHVPSRVNVNRSTSVSGGLVMTRHPEATEVTPETLTTEDIILRGNELMGVPGTTKNREGRVFKYAELVEVKAAVDALWARHEALEQRDIVSPHVFCRGGGQAIQSFYTRWDQACTAAGCPGRIPHDMRRTAVRNLNRAGVPETVAMKITGHKTRSVFDRYDITSEEDLADASRKLQALTGTITGTIDQKRAVGESRAFGRKSRSGRLLVEVTGARIELAARALKVRCSTTELPGR